MKRRVGVKRRGRLIINGVHDAGISAPIKEGNESRAVSHATFVNLGNNSTMPTTIELSAREKECLIWTAHGKSSRDIGMILKISENTVNFHIKNSMRKLGVSSRTVAVVKAIRGNIIDI